MARRLVRVLWVGVVGASTPACDDSPIEPPLHYPPLGSGGESGGSGGGAGVPESPGCTDECCPTAALCYADPELGQKSPGAECMARRDNTGQSHVQLRQTWIRAVEPAGLSNPIVYALLTGRSQFPQPDCLEGSPKSSPSGSGGYIQITDYFFEGEDKSKHFAVTGFANFVSEANLDETLDRGLCFLSDDYRSLPEYRLPTKSLAPNEARDWPAGLPRPMGLADQAWKLRPARGKRLIEPIDVSTPEKRADMLAKFADGGEYRAGGFDGVFNYDDETGVANAYSPLSFVVLWAADGASHIVVPIRDVILTSKFNDPKERNCVGAWRASALSPSESCSSVTDTNPPWGCVRDECPAGEAPAVTTGHFLIAELEQVVSDFRSTLCVTYAPGNVLKEQGFLNDVTQGCRTDKWDPTKEDGSGIPTGDWCARDNLPAHDDCHDAWHVKTFHAFAGAKVQIPDDPTAPPITCSP